MGRRDRRRRTGRPPSKRVSNHIDVHVGGRVQMGRAARGLSQNDLAEALGITYQQLLKYERGTNRVSSSRLFDLARILRLPMTFFFDGLNEDTASHQSETSQRKILEPQTAPTIKRETTELVRIYYQIERRSIRRRLTDLIRAIARASGNQG